MNKHDIILVEFPFTNLSSSKLRPALVLKNPGGSNLIVCQITTKQRNITSYEVPLKKEDCTGNIKFNSNIYVDTIFTLHKGLIKRKIGQIKNEKIKEQVELKLSNLLK